MSGPVSLRHEMRASGKYRQIIMLSGKGGTGKTTFTASFATLLQNKIVVDCDVDAANLYLLLKPRIDEETEFYGGKKAVINRSECTGCGLCEKICRFNAIKDFQIDNISCEGCGFCAKVCPENAISFEPNKSGVFYKAELEDKSAFYFAKLLPGEGNSGKLVSAIKKEAFRAATYETEWIITDGPPGIGCPVNASLSGADYVVLVAEPTLSGLHDLKRIIELLNSYKYRYGIIINKYDLNKEIADAIAAFAKNNGVRLLGLTPFNRDFVRSLQLGKTIIEYNPHMKILIEQIWSQIENQIKNSEN